MNRALAVRIPRAAARVATTQLEVTCVALIWKDLSIVTPVSDGASVFCGSIEPLARARLISHPSAGVVEIQSADRPSNNDDESL